MKNYNKYGKFPNLLKILVIVVGGSAFAYFFDKYILSGMFGFKESWSYFRWSILIVVFLIVDFIFDKIGKKSRFLWNGWFYLLVILIVIFLVHFISR